MDRKRIFRYTKYLLMKTLISFFIYLLWTNQYIYSLSYRYLKTALHKLDCENETNHHDICLLKNPFFQKPASRMSSCVHCESIRDIKKIYDTSYEEIRMVCIKQNIPVIVIDAMFDWPVLTNDLSIYNFTAVYRQPQFHDDVPCELMTNINLQTKYISDFLETILYPLMDNWFICWKNCYLHAAKAARYFYEQPYFTKYFIPAAKTNWVFISSNYKSSNFKQFSSEDNKLLMLMQIRGSQKFKLVPQNKCTQRCSSILGTLEESQILVFNSELWQLWYSLQTNGTNVAILTENDIIM